MAITPCGGVRSLHAHHPSLPQVPGYQALRENRQPNPRYSNSVVNFHITSVRLTDGAGSESQSDVGAYETWTCAACGYTEWYAQDKEGLLERLSKVADSGGRVVEPAAGRHIDDVAHDPMRLRKARRT